MKSALGNLPWDLALLKCFSVALVGAPAVNTALFQYVLAAEFAFVLAIIAFATIFLLACIA